MSVVDLPDGDAARLAAALESAAMVAPSTAMESLAGPALTATPGLTVAAKVTEAASWGVEIQLSRRRELAELAETAQAVEGLFIAADQSIAAEFSGMARPC